MDDDFEQAKDEKEGAELIQQLQAKLGSGCVACGRSLCSHQVLGSIALGFGAQPRCLPCTATALDQDVASLRQSLFHYFQGRACYWTAWRWASQQERVDPESIPGCFDSTSS